MKTDRLVFHTAVLAAVDLKEIVFCSSTTQAINRILYGCSEATDGRRKCEQLLRGLQTGVFPCKGILQARFTRHYREIFGRVVRRNGTEKGRQEAFLGRSEGLQGFDCYQGCRFFFHKFWRSIIFVQKTIKNCLFHYMLCFESVFGSSRHN